MPEKRNLGFDLWQRGIDAARAEDHLPVYDCGSWTLEKLYFLSNYLAQFTQAMAGNSKFASVNFVGLFAGSGVCRAPKGDASAKRYPGSSLLASLCSKPFDRLILVEDDQASASALELRIKRVGYGGYLRIITKQVDDSIRDVVSSIPPGSLTVAFVDPYSLNFSYESIKELASNRPLDLLLLFADEMELVRNVELYRNDTRMDTNLDRFLGSEVDWRKKWDTLVNREASNVRQMFAEIYRDQLAKIGYTHFEVKPIPTDGRPLYRLIYASKHRLGLHFWHIAEGQKLSGERRLFGY